MKKNNFKRILGDKVQFHMASGPLAYAAWFNKRAALHIMSICHLSLGAYSRALVYLKKREATNHPVRNHLKTCSNLSDGVLV